MEYSMDRLEPEPVIDNYDDFLKKLDDAIDIAKMVLQIKSLIPEKLDQMEALSEIGEFIQRKKGESGDRPKAIIEKLKEFDDVMKELESKMVSLLDDVKKFVSYLEFSLDINTEAFILTRLMRDCFKYGTEDSIEKFHGFYKKHSPINLAYTLLNLLEQKSTNPFAMSMGDEITDEMNARWAEVFVGAIAHFTFIEAFSGGLLKDQNMFTFYKLHEKTVEVSDKVEKWKKEYILLSELTEDMSIFTGANSEAKLDEIEEKIRNYRLNHTIHVAIFTKDANWGSYSHRPARRSSQNYFRTIDTTVVCIYPSYTANQVQQFEYDEMEKTIKANIPKEYNSLESAVDELILGKGHYERDCFALLGLSYGSIHVRSVNSSGEEVKSAWYDEKIIPNSVWHSIFVAFP